MSEELKKEQDPEEENPKTPSDTMTPPIGIKKLNLLKEEVKLLVGEVETQRSFIDNLKHRLKSLELSKHKIDEKNQFLQKNIQRLIKEKVTLLQRVEEMRQTIEREEENQPEAEEADTTRIIPIDFPKDFTKNPKEGLQSIKFPHVGGWIENAQDVWESLKKKIVQEFVELETRYQNSQKTVARLQETILKMEQEKEESVQEKNNLLQFLGKLRESYQKLTGEMDDLWSSQDLDNEPDVLSIPHEKLRPSLRQEEDLTSLPPEGEDSSYHDPKGEETREIEFSPRVYKKFLEFLLAKKEEIVLPKPSPDAAIGYIYADVVDWGFIKRGEEASFLEEGVKKGYFTKKIINKVHLCPQCFRYNLNFRKTCPQCLGIDYDKNPPYYCNNCEKEFAQLRAICQCLHCQFSFSLEKAILCNLYQYEISEDGKELVNSKVEPEKK